MGLLDYVKSKTPKKTDPNDYSGYSSSPLRMAPSAETLAPMSSPGSAVTNPGLAARLAVEAPNPPGWGQRAESTPVYQGVNAMSRAGQAAVANAQPQTVANSRPTEAPAVAPVAPQITYRPGDRISGDVVYESATGIPRAYASPVQFEWNQPMDSRLYNARQNRQFGQNYSNGLGTGVGPGNIIAMEAAKARDAAEKAEIQAGWKAWHDRQRELKAEQQPYGPAGKTGASAPLAAASAGPSLEEAVAQAGGTMREPTQAPVQAAPKRSYDYSPEQLALNAQATAERRQAIADNRRERLGLEARFRAGTPRDQEEAQRFLAMQGMRTAPVQTLGMLRTLAQSDMENQLKAARIAQGQAQLDLESQKQNYLQSPAGLANGLLLSGRSPDEIKAMGLPLPGAGVAPIETPLQKAQRTAATAQELRKLDPTALMSRLEGVLRASAIPNFDMNEAMAAGIDPQILQTIIDYKPMYPNRPLSQALLTAPFQESQLETQTREELQRLAAALRTRMAPAPAAVARN